MQKNDVLLVERKLLKGYDSRIRPANPKSPDLAPNVMVTFELFYFEYVDNVKGHATMVVSYVLEWTDMRLRSRTIPK